MELDNNGMGGGTPGWIWTTKKVGRHIWITAHLDHSTSGSQHIWITAHLEHHVPEALGVKGLALGWRAPVFLPASPTYLGSAMTEVSPTLRHLRPARSRKMRWLRTCSMKSSMLSSSKFSIKSTEPTSMALE